MQIRQHAFRISGFGWHFIVMIEANVYQPERHPATGEKQEIIQFLSEHLGPYGDPEPDIEKAMDYALSSSPEAGGAILTLKENGQLLGAAVVNHTGMKGYIPENILVYIATHGAHRGKGLGSQLMHKIMREVPGDIALHVEPENPAKRLYERLGFTNKYLEMRLHRNEQNKS